MIATVATHQIRSLARQRTFLAMLAILGTMTALAGLLGWSSNHTTVRVYDEAVILLESSGQPAPTNPIGLKPALSLLSNMVIYVPLIGALLALILGHLSLADDQTSGIGRLVFSRPIPRRAYVAGKITGAAVVLAAIMVASMLISVASLLIINHSIAFGDFARLAGFYALSWLYLMVFALVGMIAVAVNRRRSLSLLTAMGAWLTVTFVVPQFTSGLRPTATLNPVADPVSNSQAFFRATAHARPYSIAEQYKEASSQILATATTTDSSWHTITRIAPIIGVVVLLCVSLLALLGRHDYSRSATDD